MRDDQRGPSEKAGSADRKTRIKGNRVIHTPNGSIYHGDADERPRGLTTEQWNAQKNGAKIDERQIREGAQGIGQATQWGDINEQAARPGERLNGTDEVTETKAGQGGKHRR